MDEKTKKIFERAIVSGNTELVSKMLLSDLLKNVTNASDPFNAPGPLTEYLDGKKESVCSKRVAMDKYDPLEEKLAASRLCKNHERDIKRALTDFRLSKGMITPKLFSFLFLNEIDVDLRILLHSEFVKLVDDIISKSNELK